MAVFFCEIHLFLGLRLEKEEFTCFLGRALYACSCCRPWCPRTARRPRTARHTRLFTQQTVEEVGQHSLICCCSYKHTQFKHNDLRWQWGYSTDINLPCVMFKSKHTSRFTITTTIILKGLSLLCLLTKNWWKMKCLNVEYDIWYPIGWEGLRIQLKLILLKWLNLFLLVWNMLTSWA